MKRSEFLARVAGAFAASNAAAMPDEGPFVDPEIHIERAAAILNAGERIAILIGAGAARAAPEVIEIAELLQAGVAKALLGKAVLPDHLAFSTGQIGLLGTTASYRLMSECDTLLMIGSTFPYSEFLPKEGQAKGVQIDTNPEMLSLRYPMDVALVGEILAHATRAR